MRLVESVADARQLRVQLPPPVRIGLVPTMGALHDGHLSLVTAARATCDLVVASVFVNPLQFGPGEDFERYPRDLEGDRAKLAGAGVDVVFAPSVVEMYPPGVQTRVVPGALADRWEGTLRPGHFEGVATVVTKLLSIVRPDAAFFGEKDYQQLQVVRQLATDLDLGVDIVGCPIIRDADGLALSSRNAYLSTEQRHRALGLSAALRAAGDAVAAGERDAEKIGSLMRECIEQAGVDVDYAAVVDAVTLEPLAAVDTPARALVAGRVGSTRLIDNAELLPARP